MAATDSRDQDGLRRFLRRVWRQDITPLLTGRQAAQRRRAARVSGKVAAGAGLVLDSLLRLKGRPFTRSLTVVGSTFGAILPDAWDWQWLRTKAAPAEQEVVREQVARRAGELDAAEALALFNLTPAASAAQLKQAWREAAARWHPDHAPDEAGRAEHHVRFVAYQAAYQRLQALYESGDLPQRAE